MEVVIAAVIFLAIGGGAGFFLWGRSPHDSSKIREEYREVLTQASRLEAELNQKTEKVGELHTQLKQLDKEKNEFAGANKRLILENKELTGENRALKKEADELKAKVGKFEEQHERKEKEHAQKLEKLDGVKKALEDEKARVRREDEERLQQLEQERDRIWNDHENLVLAALRQACQRPTIGFQSFDNTNLPPNFTGKLKPDFLVEFLGHYIIFDAKKSKNPHNYIREQVKETAKKLKGRSDIYPTVFFVMPTDEIDALKETYFFEEGFSFHVIDRHAIDPLLANFKKITEYEKIQDFDPQDRENIVNLIAGYDRHISFQNAANILLAQESIGLMRSKESSLNEELVEEIKIKKNSMRELKLNPTDVRKLENLDRQHKEIESIVEAKPDIEAKDLTNAQNSLLI